MPPYDRAIIGAGTSAAVYLSYFPVQEEEKVVVIGFPEPWSKRGQHRMGQPPHLIELPLPPRRPRHFKSRIGSGFAPPLIPNEAPYRVPRLRRHFEAPRNQDTPPEEPFLTSSRYARSVEELLGGVERIAAKVLRVSKDGNYKIDLEGHEKISADKVIIASGPGQATVSRAWKQEYAELPKGTFVSGEAFLNDDIPVIQGVVAVEGGSATGAWAVEKALMGGATGVFWFNRVTPEAENNTLEKRFGDAYPAGGRNEWLKRKQDKIIWAIASVQGSRAVDGNKLEVTFVNGLRITVSQYVAAIGAAGGLNYVEEGLKNSLKPIKDTRKLLETKGEAVLGYKSDDGSLLAVGPAIKHDGGYRKANNYLPQAARPLEGIPTIIATMSALRAYVEGGQERWVGFNLQSFGEMDAYFYNAVGYFLATHLGDELAKEGLGGYTLQQVAQFVTDQVIGSRIMKSSPYGVTEAEIEHVFDQIWDFAYKHLGVKRGVEWKPLLDAYFS